MCQLSKYGNYEATVSLTLKKDGLLEIHHLSTSIMKFGIKTGRMLNKCNTKAGD